MHGIVEAIARLEKVNERDLRLLQASPSANAVVVEAPGLIYKFAMGAPLYPASEQAMWSHGRRAGMQTPILRRTGEVAGRAFIAYNKLLGAAPKPTDDVLVSAGRALARLHAAPPRRGYPMSQRARPRRMRRFGIALESSKASALRRWAEYRPLIADACRDWETSHSVATHGDYRCANLLVVDGTLTGVIDWSDGRMASRESDLGGVDARALPLVMTGYSSVNDLISIPLVRGYALARIVALWESSVISDDAASDTLSTLDKIFR
ncbi:phosphotransferase enzyme family protein [uncultured Microbacterium sp.]|uniref:phosphotransferase enzyme family protein n=1 Tax=uncultured Microbacterium sp. TaxID=191216 RepID=UPI0035CB2D22